MTSRPLPAEPLMTACEAAGKLGMSVKTLKAHVASGQLRLINIGTATRKRHRFTTYNLTTFIEKRKVTRPQGEGTRSADLRRHSQ